MAPAEAYRARPSGRRDDDDSADDGATRRGEDDRRHGRRSSRERYGSRARRRSLTPDSSPRRRHHRQRDYDGDRGRDRGRDRSSGRDRGRDRSTGRDRGRDRSTGRDRGRDRSTGRDRDREGSASRDRTRRSSRERKRAGRRQESHPATADRDDPKGPRKDLVKHRGPLPSQQESFSHDHGDGSLDQPKEKVNWANTGALAAASNSVVQADGSSTTLKYHEPSEARKPSPRDQWKLFVFKGGDIVDTIDLNLKSCWLVGRDSGVVDVLAEHPSISKQHAVIQFRYTEKRNEFGDKIGKVKPYLLDLESANGSVLNDDAVPQSRFLELRPKDMILFGHSTREYVVMLAPRD
ncbi:hypothetical protein CDD83_9332 [Cordyceps sp. RAO-2017]|nr:hypothetical protein CDD83_9332 [Cordyceps sp. RAO-2017]